MPVTDVGAMRGTVSRLVAAYESFMREVERFRSYDGYDCLFGSRDDSGIPPSTAGGVPWRADLRWPFEAEQAWFRARITMPERVAGIPVNGAATLSYASVMSSELYINGERRLSEPWWTALDVPLSGAVRPGDTFDIAIRMRRIDGNDFMYGFPPQMIVDSVEEATVHVGAFVRAAELMLRCLELRQVRDARLVSLFASVMERVPVALLEDHALPAFLRFVREVQRDLAPVGSFLKKRVIHLVGHAHLDINWMWDWENTVDTQRRTFEQVDRLLAEYPEFRFTNSQAAMYEVIREADPALFKRIRRHVHSGRWEVAAGAWVEGDLHMSGTEALVRQFLLGQRFCAEHLGGTTSVGWFPDTFGHPATLPQILRKCGIRSYYSYKGGRDKTTPVFLWEGLDGSRVTAFNESWGYSLPVTPDTARRLVHATGYGVSRDLVCYGVGDHGGGPTRRDLQRARILRETAFFPAVRCSTAEEYFAGLSRDRVRLPVIAGELPYEYGGCYTSHADIKRYNRRCEQALTAAETLSVMASVAGLPYPARELHQAWRRVCLNQFHDTLAGTSIGLAYDHARRLAEESLAAAAAATGNAAKRIASVQVSTADRFPVTVINTLAWPRSVVVEVDLHNRGWAGATVTDSTGRTVPSQVCDGVLWFRGTVPSVGWAVFHVVRGAERQRCAPEDSLVFRALHSELQLDPVTGRVVRLRDLRTGRELLDRLEHGNTLRLYTEEGHWKSSWVLGSIRSVEHLRSRIVSVRRGPVADTIRLECAFGGSALKQTIVVHHHADLVEFRTRLNWAECGTERDGVPTLRAAFPTTLGASVVRCEVPFGSVDRPANGEEYPALRWAGFSDGRHSIALINDCKHGYRVLGGCLELTLVRSPYQPDRRADQGSHEFTYALLFHRGDAGGPEVVRTGWELNTPPVVVPAEPARMDAPGDSCRRGVSCGGVPSSLLQCTAPSVVVSAIKQAEDGEGIIVRAYEACGSRVLCRFVAGMQVHAVVETDLLERNGRRIRTDGYAFNVAFKPREIRTFRLRLTPRPHAG
jgi:alpha-mannosidase